MRLGTGIGWRPEIADAVEGMPGIGWVEVVAENVCPGHLPESLLRLRGRGVTVVPHGVSLGLGGAERPDAKRLAALAERARADHPGARDLSAGMTADLEEAVAAGSTLLRVGTALFGTRPLPSPGDESHQSHGSQRSG